MKVTCGSGLCGALIFLQTVTGHTYLDKLLGASGGPTLPMDASAWLLAVPVTLFYGTFVVLNLLLRLATQDIVGALSVGALLLFAGLGLWGRRSRPVALLVLAWFNTLLGLPITIAATGDDPVLAWTLLANIPALAIALFVTFRFVRRLQQKM